MEIVLSLLVFVGSYFLSVFLFKLILKYSFKLSLGVSLFGIFSAFWYEIRFGKEIIFGYQHSFWLLFSNTFLIVLFWLDKRRREKKKHVLNR